jgi:hypothetical protein
MKLKLDRNSDILRDKFKTLCGMSKESMETAKLTKQQLRTHLTEKYKAPIAERILKFFSLPPLYIFTFETYCILLEKFLNSPYEVIISFNHFIASNEICVFNVGFKQRWKNLRK